MSKVLIYKTGHSETLSEDQPNKIVSLGDVLRTTPIVHALAGYEIHWITSKESLPLLDGIKELSSVTTIDQFPQELAADIDLLINLEKDHLLKKKLRFSDQVKKIGFSSKDPRLVSTLTETIDKAALILKLKESCKPTLQDFLFKLLGKEFKGQEYLISPIEPVLDLGNHRVGLNWKVGQKWPGKTPTKQAWESLAKKIESKNIAVSWQKGFDDLNEYISWINSNSLIITADSLGMHIALALKKTTVVFFGPTSAQEVYHYGNLHKYDFDVPHHYDCLPCYSKTCHMEKNCNLFLKEDRLLDTVSEIIKSI